MEIAVLMPVAPGDHAEFHDTVDSITAWEPAVRQIVATVDDEPTRAQLRRSDVAVEVLPPPIAVGNLADRIAAALIAAMAWAHRNSSADVLLKLDTDALVIAPFARGLETAFVGGVGLVGAYRTGPSGPRSFHPWDARTRRLVRPVYRRNGVPALALTGRRARMRRLIRLARRNGYPWGEHALGAAMAIS